MAIAIYPVMEKIKTIDGREIVVTSDLMHLVLILIPIITVLMVIFYEVSK